MLRFCVLVLLTSLLAAPAAAEVYTWTDRQGRVHMTDDLSKVPVEHRKAAAGARREEVESPREWNAVDPAPAHRSAESAAGTAPAAPAGTARGGRVHVLAVERAGAEMRVTAELDGGVRAPFIVDTGAMINTMPRSVAVELGLELDGDTQSTLVQGISGQPMLVPVVTLRSVRVGEAEVEDVEFAVLSTQSRGLLGMPFFNHFKVSTDPARGLLTLEEIDLSAVSGVYGGQNEAAWRRDFAMVHAMLERVEHYRSRIPSGLEGFADQEQKLDEMQEYWERQLDELELKASRAGVPRAWRE